MIDFSAEIQKTLQKGAKMGWSYIEIPMAIAQQLKPDYRQFYRVRGEIDGQSFAGLALTPVGDGDYILPLNGQMRKLLRKRVGDVLFLRLEEDQDFNIEIPEDLAACLLEDGNLMERFTALPKSHRNYFIKYINEAKTEPTRTKRLTMTVEALMLEIDFGAMIRLNKSRKQQ